MVVGPSIDLAQNYLIRFLVFIRSVLSISFSVVPFKIPIIKKSQQFINILVWNSRPGIFFTKREEDEGSDAVCMVISTVR